MTPDMHSACAGKAPACLSTSGPRPHSSNIHRACPQMSLVYPATANPLSTLRPSAVRPQETEDYKKKRLQQVIAPTRHTINHWCPGLADVSRLIAHNLRASCILHTHDRPAHTRWLLTSTQHCPLRCSQRLATHCQRVITSVLVLFFLGDVDFYCVDLCQKYGSPTGCGLLLDVNSGSSPKLLCLWLTTVFAWSDTILMLCFQLKLS